MNGTFEQKEAKEAKGAAGAVALLVMLLCGCTTVYERGRKLVVIGSNVKGLHMVSAEGTRVDIAEVDNSGVHRAAGAAVGNGAVGIGSGVASSGLLGIFK